MAQQRLVLGIVSTLETAQQLRFHLEQVGLDAQVATKRWRGSDRPMVFYFAPTRSDAELLEELLEQQGIPGEVLKDDVQTDSGGEPEDQAATVPDRLVTLIQSESPHDVRLLASILKDEGIDALATEEVSGSTLNGQPVIQRLMIRAADHDSAIRVLERARQLQESLPEEEEDDEAWQEEIIAWPRCPECGQPRETTCPKCKTTGADMPQPEGYLEAGGEDEGETQLQVICPLCDWLFTPEFYRRCVWCGHDFGSGLEVEVPARRTHTDAAEVFNGRVVAVIIGLGLLVVAAGFYFAWLVS